jgi:4-hydroxybenzoate polyprenyltransferase
MRPANIMTAIADILLGCSVVAALDLEAMWLVLSTIGLYGGGVVFNDVFDAELDKVERPERPIPSGKVSIMSATLLGTSLLLFGIISAGVFSIASGAIALVVALLALSYDKFAKHHSFWGPLNMGACRGGNLLLGLSYNFNELQNHWFLVIIPILYIAMITMISRGEVHGGKKTYVSFGLLLYALVIALVVSLNVLKDFEFIFILPFLAVFIALTLPKLLSAYSNPEAMPIRNAVKAGVISLIVLDATIAAGFSGWPVGLLILCCLPLSIAMAKWFAVT